MERPYQRPVPGPREVRTPHHPWGGGGADAAGARAHTHERDTRGLPEEQPDRARGTHRPRGMAYQRARVRDTRTERPATRSAGHAGGQRETGETQHQVPARTPRTGQFGSFSSRDRSRRKIKYPENDAPQEEKKRKIVFFDRRNPPNNFTPLFGEVAKFGTLTKKNEQ